MKTKVILATTVFTTLWATAQHSGNANYSEASGNANYELQKEMSITGIIRIRSIGSIRYKLPRVLKTRW